MLNLAILKKFIIDQKNPTANVAYYQLQEKERECDNPFWNLS
jgi:hypothetical protein